MEATALRNGLFRPVSNVFVLRVINDNQVLINALIQQGSFPWQLRTLIADIRSYLDSLEQFSILHMYHEGNLIADFLSKFGHHCSHSFSTSSVLPAFLSSSFIMIG